MAKAKVGKPVHEIERKAGGGVVKVQIFLRKKRDKPNEIFYTLSLLRGYEEGNKVRWSRQIRDTDIPLVNHALGDAFKFCLEARLKKQ